MRRLILPVMIIGILFGVASSALAQIQLPNDTMKVVDSYGRPGDTIQVDLYISNMDIVLQGYGAVVFLNPNALQYIGIQRIGRNGDTLETIDGRIYIDSMLVISAVTWSPNIPGHVLHHGHGVVARMTFRIRPSTQYGDRTYLRFGTDPTTNHFENAWADTTGSGDIFYPRLVDGSITVTGGTSNQPPVIGSIGTQEVREGQILQFPVTSYDLDGDIITLSASSLPANASFPTVQGDSTVSGTFTFAPTFEQGPDTFIVTFTAVDDHNNTTPMMVPIIVLDQPNDFLSVVGGQGGVPGALTRDINIELFNSRNVYGLQFNYFYDHNQIDVADVIPTDRCAGLGFWYSEPVLGRIVVLVFSPGLDPIIGGTGPIMRFVTNVNTAALVGRTPVVLDSAIEVIDSIGTSRSLVTNSGYFTVDRFGDANLDEHVNVGDCVTIVAFIIDRVTLDVRQFDAADINRDTRVNVSDLQNVIDQILQIPLSPGPVPPTPLAFVELKKDADISGDIITIPLWADVGTEAAALQYDLSYNAETLEPLDVEPGSMVQNLRFDHSVGDGKAKGVFYDLGGSTFGPSTGELATFRFRLKNNSFSPRDIRLNEFLIVDRASAFIPSEIKGQLPTDYILNQNYPNPFNSSTMISFDLPDNGQVELSIYDVLGRKVTTLLNENMSAGNHSVTWNGRSDNGESVATGVFFYRLQSKDFDQTKRMLLVK